MRSLDRLTPSRCRTLAPALLALAAWASSPVAAGPDPPKAPPPAPAPAHPLPGFPPGTKPPVQLTPARPAQCAPVGSLPAGEAVPAERILRDLREGKNVQLKGALIEGNLDFDLDSPPPADERRFSLRVITGLLRLESCRVAGRVAFRRTVFLQGLEMPCTEIRGDLDLGEADLPALVAPHLHVIGPVRLGGIGTGDDIDLSGAVLDDRLEVGGRIRGGMRLGGAELRGGMEMTRAVVDEIDLTFAKASAPVRLQDLLVLSDLEARDGTFARGLSLEAVRVGGDADFDDTRSPAGITLAGFALSGDLGLALAGETPLTMTDVDVRGDLSLFDGRLGALVMDRVKVHGDTEFESCRFPGKVTIRDTDFGAEFSADEAAFLGDCEFRHVRFPGADPMAGVRFARAPTLVDTTLPVPPTVEGEGDGSGGEDEDLDFQDVAAPEK